MHMTADRVARAVSAPTRVVWRRQVAKYARSVHIYVSMAAFALVFFFALTGITLNHPDWGAGAERTTERHGHLDPAWTGTAAAEPARLEIVEFLRRTDRLSGAVADFRVDPADLSIAFKGPGYAADVLIDRATGNYDVTETRLGFFAVMNDLHKGRDTGGVWKGLIDTAAAVLALISLSGLVLLYFLHRNRTAGLVLLLMGGAAGYVAYLAWVP
jgi:hypothetical protein